MHQERLERCSNDCCHFVDGKTVTKAEYAAAIARHPGNYPGVKPGQRNAVLETVIACRRSIYQQQIEGGKAIVRDILAKLAVDLGQAQAKDLSFLETDKDFDNNEVS